MSLKTLQDDLMRNKSTRKIVVRVMKCEVSNKTCFPFFFQNESNEIFLCELVNLITVAILSIDSQ